ncbi:MAG: hypothetical protein HY062_16865 [Bacteroidetes bacterium]|nr:hypothetical protein [Bacteroidota bacterium]
MTNINSIISSIIVILVLLGCDHQGTEVTENKTTRDSAAATETEQDTSELNYKSYCNDRYGFCVDYPSDILIPQGESDGGDGQTFTSKDGQNTLAVFRDYDDMLSENAKFTIASAYQMETKENSDDPKKEITYKKLGKTFFVISGYNAGKIFYQKTIFANDQLATCILTYKESEKSTYDQISKHVFTSFK